MSGQNFRQNYYWASRITTGVDGSIYQLGFTDGSFDNKNNSGKTDFFIIKFNSEGKNMDKILWNIGRWYAVGITTDNDGSLYVIGRTGEIYSVFLKVVE